VQEAAKSLSRHIDAAAKAKETMQGDRNDVVKYAKTVATFMNELPFVEQWNNFESTQRTRIRRTIEQERFAIDVLDDYVRNKDAAKEMCEEEYKLFKEAASKLAESL
jgi:hypothetical protein